MGGWPRDLIPTAERPGRNWPTQGAYGPALELAERPEQLGGGPLPELGRYDLGGTAAEAAAESRREAAGMGHRQSQQPGRPT